MHQKNSNKSPKRPASEHRYHDNEFIQHYKKFLIRFNDLKDCAYFGNTGQRNVRFTDAQLAEFRNTKSGVIEIDGDGRRPVRLYRNRYHPTYNHFAAHLIQQRESSIFASNSGADELLMLADIDNKAGTGAADEAAEYLGRKYLDGQTYIEHSTFGNGRHVYFRLDTTMCGVSYPFDRRDDLWDYLTVLSDAIKADDMFAEFGVTFDSGCLFYGLPTLWAKNEEGRWYVERRGSQLKLPYCPEAGADLVRLASLRPQSLDQVISTCRRYTRGLLPAPPPSTTISPICVGQDAAEGDAEAQRKENPTRTQVDIEVLDGPTKKYRCVDMMLQRTNGLATLDEVVAEYEANWKPTYRPDENEAKAKRQRRQKIASLLKKRRSSFVPYKGHKRAFRKGQYTDLVRALVPASEFIWERRERLDHERLADFLSIKIQDAFTTTYKKNGKVIEKVVIGMTARDSTIKNAKKMREKGLIDWALTTNTYSKLLDISKRYKLLEVVKEYQRPIRDPRSKRVLVKGNSRVIAPGDALPDERREWLAIFKKHEERMSQSLAAGWASIRVA